MKLQEIMTRQVIRIHPEESVTVAARLLTNHNIGVLPVCYEDGTLCGMLTDRDLVLRCIASEQDPAKTKVRDVMTARIVSVAPDMEVAAAAHLMGREQVRRLPVLKSGKLCGMITVGDLAGREENSYDAAEALEGICGNVSKK